MALNSFVTRDGLEMGRAQVVQAQAAGIEPDVRMNPILLKPSSDVGSQVIVNGEVRGQMKAADYFRHKKQLIPDILAAYNSLAEDVDIIVIEGAGSPAEINPQGGRHCQHGAGQTGGCPRSAGRRYRPGRRVRPALRHCGAAGAGGAGPHSGTHHQQIPGGCGNSAPGPDHAGRKNAPARAGRGALPERGH